MRDTRGTTRFTVTAWASTATNINNHRIASVVTIVAAAGFTSHLLFLRHVIQSPRFLGFQSNYKAKPRKPDNSAVQYRIDLRNKKKLV